MVDALGTWFRDVVLDGELVVCRGGGLDFTVPQRRLASPCDWFRVPLVRVATG